VFLTKTELDTFKGSV